MKKFIANLNPFVLLMIPVLFALVLGVTYQFEQAHQFAASNMPSVEHATSLFAKGVHMVKVVCAISADKVW